MTWPYYHCCPTTLRIHREWVTSLTFAVTNMFTYGESPFFLSKRNFDADIFQSRPFTSLSLIHYLLPLIPSLLIVSSDTSWHHHKSHLRVQVYVHRLCSELGVLFHFYLYKIKTIISIKLKTIFERRWFCLRASVRTHFSYRVYGFWSVVRPHCPNNWSVSDPVVMKWILE